MSDKSTKRGRKPSTNAAIVAISRVIAKSRKTQGLTQRNAAEKIGMDYRHFQDVEKGKVDIRISSLFEMQKQLDLKLEDFFCSKFASPTCPASTLGPNLDKLWEIVFEKAETGKCGLIIVKKSEVVFANKYLRTSFSKSVAGDIKISSLNDLTAPPVLSLPQVANCQEGHAGPPTLVKMTVANGMSVPYVVFPKKSDDSISILFLSLEFVSQKLSETLAMIPLFQLTKLAKASV